MVFLPIQRIDPVIQVLIEATVQADVQEEQVEPAL
jgi:CRISPR/Cas system-associated protein Csm6